MSGPKMMRTKMVSLRPACSPKKARIHCTKPGTAEDYYAADYPDEEVDSEDEYNRAAYQYRTGNASDLEEYDIALDHEGEDSGEPDLFRARFGARPSAAFGRP